MQKDVHIISDKRQGFTILEVLISIALFSVLSLGVIILVSNVFTSANKQSGLLSDQDYARKAVFTLLTELRNAQYGNDGSYPLGNAGDQDLVFYSNPGNQPTAQRIHYFLSNGQLMKGVIQFANNTYATSTEVDTVILKDIANGANPIFSYFDSSYTGSAIQTPLSQPINVTAAKFIQINLKIANMAGVDNKNFYIITQGGTIRNLKTNLGN